MHGRWKVAVAGFALAAAVIGAGVSVGASAPAGPRMVSGSGSCTTDAAGVCTIAHTLGTTPDSVVVSPATPGAFNGYMLNVVGGSYTASTFKVRAMFTPTQPKANGAIWIAYVASIGVQPPPPPPPTTSTVPPTTSTTAPPTTSTTTAPPTTTTVTPPTTTIPPAGTCPGGAKPTTFAEQDGGDFGPYFIHNNAWNWQGAGSGQVEKLYACSASKWWVDDYGFKPANGEVFMYPNVHLDVNGGNGKPLSTWPSTITGRFAATGPGAGSYDVAWDLWLNGLADNNSLELMVWTEAHGNAEPAGTKRGTWTDASTGKVYDVWWDGAQKGGYLAYVSQTTQHSGTVDLRAMIVNAQKQGYLAAGDTLVNQIDFGNEVRDTAGATAANPYRFAVTDFALTMN